MGWVADRLAPAEFPARQRLVTGSQSRTRDGGLDRISLPEGAPGALWLCGKRVTAPDPEAALARADNADAIICFNQASDLADEYPLYLDWLGRNDGRRAMWHPIRDFGAPPLVTAQAWVGGMVDRLAIGEGLILHCSGGIGRAPTMAICVLVALGLSTEEAARRVAASRSMAGPEADVQQTLVSQFGSSWR